MDKVVTAPFAAVDTTADALAVALRVITLEAVPVAVMVMLDETPELPEVPERLEVVCADEELDDEVVLLTLLLQSRL